MGSYATKFSVVSKVKDAATVATDVLVVPVFKLDEPKKRPDKDKKKKAKADEDKGPQWIASATFEAVDKAMGGTLRQALDAEKFGGDCGKARAFHVRSGDTVKARWVVVVGLGPIAKLDLKKATSAFQGALKDTFGFDKMATAAVVLPAETSDKLQTGHFVQAAVCGAVAATYKTREAGEEKLHKLEAVQLLLPAGLADPGAAMLNLAQAMAQAEAMVKDLANRPANLKTPEDLAEAARAIGQLPKVTVDVESDPETIRKEMPAFWAVAQASANTAPPRFIRVAYRPGGKANRHIALVGKGVIFDTGGVQVKPGDYMNDMKFDMTGAATVLGVMKAIATLGLKNLDVTAYVAATPNLISETAYLPDSIIDTASGRKIEIRHTDAEGRVTLADAVYKAVQDAPDEIVTVATLTGSAANAVGHCIALMGTDDALVARLNEAGRAVGETVQPFDLLEMDYDAIKSDRDAADLLNTSKVRQRGHLSAGAFVLTFAEEIPAAHMDIAGGDAKDGNATGIAVKGLIEYLRRQAS